MAVRLVTGKSGSGKSLFMLYQLVKRFLKYDKETELFSPKDEKMLIITNIDGFTQDIEHLRLQQEIEYINFRKMCHEIKGLIKAGKQPESLIGYDIEKLNWYINEYEFEGLHKLPSILRDYYIEERKENEVSYFFKNKVQKAYLEGNHSGKAVIYVLDEAQQYFPASFKDRDCCYFFEYHRHYGCEIYMATQHRNLLSRALRDNIEVEYSAVRKSITSGKIYAYNIIYDGVKAGMEVLKNPKMYYPLYSSAFVHSGVKEKNLMLRYIILISCLFLGAFSLLAYRFMFSDKAFGVHASEIPPPAKMPTVKKEKRSNTPKTVSAAPVQRFEWQKVNYYCLGNECYFLSEMGFSPLPTNPKVYKKVGNTVYLYMPAKEEKEEVIKKDYAGRENNRFIIGGTDS